MQEKKTVVFKYAGLLFSDLFRPSTGQLYGIVLFSTLLILAFLITAV